MKLFNTLTKKIEDFKPLDCKVARVYSCGPTVYNHAHIGNLSSYVASDILHRTLKLAGYDVKRVMNFTDVDDKTIRDSAAAFPDLSPMDALIKFTRQYEKIFLREMRETGNLVDEVHFKRATESIVEMQRLITELLRMGIAYTADDGIYFSIAKYSKTRKYGQLTHVDLARDARSRIDNDEYDKDTAADFVLWKKQKDNEPAWEFEIDSTRLTGRPGWHIECSAMSVDSLGQPFDIHTGGVDLIFPHHENEIAQSTAGDQPEIYANSFVHNEHLLVDGKKMSKSAHNFYALPDIVAKGYDPLDFRMLVLQSHYCSATNFSWQSLDAARNRLRKWRTVAELRWQTADSRDDGQAEIINNLLSQATTALLNDLDTPQALKHIDAAVEVFMPDNIHHFALQNLVQFIDDCLGLRIAETTPDITDKQKDLISQRRTARDNQDFEASDKIRDELLEQGIKIKDSSIGPIWHKQ